MWLNFLAGFGIRTPPSGAPKDVRNPRYHGNGVQTGQTSDGRTLTIRTRGNNGPTLDIKHPNGDVEKIRLQG